MAFKFGYSPRSKSWQRQFGRQSRKTDFEDFTGDKKQFISDYISLFDQKYHFIAKKYMTLPPPILAFKRFKGAHLSKAKTVSAHRDQLH